MNCIQPGDTVEYMGRQWIVWADRYSSTFRCDIYYVSVDGVSSSEGMAIYDREDLYKGKAPIRRVANTEDAR